MTCYYANDTAAKPQFNHKMAYYTCYCCILYMLSFILFTQHSCLLKYNTGDVSVKAKQLYWTNQPGRDTEPNSYGRTGVG